MRDTVAGAFTGTARQPWCGEKPRPIRRPAPEFGEHTEEVLIDLLGYSWEQIAALKEREVI
ncbi:MAG: hypothetical protein ACRD0H_07395 [Actinomycetes bacterium]